MANESAAELVARMLTSYAIASSYADRGAATSYVGMLRVDFRTEFVRGHRLRFEYRREHDRRVIWSDGVHTYTRGRSSSGDTEIIDDGAELATAIAAATGVSSGTSHTVPAMLLPLSIGAGSFSFAQLGELRLDGEENIGSCSCARIDGRSPRGELTTLWIARDTYLLRRTVTGRGSRFETTTSYEPSLAPIDVSWIQQPDIKRTAPRPREPLAWKGIRLAIGSRRVETVDEGSPAARSGLAPGDEIEAVNGKATDRFVDVFIALHYAKIGEPLALTIRRGSDTLEVVVHVEARPSQPRAAPSKPLVE